jgi:peroxiredoxin
MRSFDTLDAEVLGVSVDAFGRTKRMRKRWGQVLLLADFQPRGARLKAAVAAAKELRGGRL